MKDISRHYLISRHINGIVLNPLEFVLDENNELIKFDTVKKAKELLGLAELSVEEIEEKYGWYITLAEQDLDTLIREGGKQ